MLDMVSGPAPGDPFIITQPVRPYAQEANTPAERLRIAWTANSWQPSGFVDPEVVRCVEQVVSKCERAGHELIEASPVFDYEEYLKAMRSLGLWIVCRDGYVRICDGPDN
jgi:amidase